MDNYVILIYSHNLCACMSTWHHPDKHQLSIFERCVFVVKRTHLHWNKWMSFPRGYCFRCLWVLKRPTVVVLSVILKNYYILQQQLLFLDLKKWIQLFQVYFQAFQKHAPGPHLTWQPTCTWSILSPPLQKYNLRPLYPKASGSFCDENRHVVWEISFFF